MRAYSELYIGDIMETQGQLFLNIRDELPNVDEKWFIRTYMKCRIRKMLDIGNPKYANRSSYELISDFMYELETDYKCGEPWGGFLPQWVGLIYAYYQWYYNVPSAELVDILPLETMERVFPVLHQCGEKTAIEKIHDDVLIDIPKHIKNRT